MRALLLIALPLALWLPTPAEACPGPFAEFTTVFHEVPAAPDEAAALHGRLVFAGEVFEDALSPVAAGSEEDPFPLGLFAVLEREGEPSVRLYARFSNHGCDRSDYSHQGELWVVGRFDPALGESDALLMQRYRSGAWEEP